MSRKTIALTVLTFFIGVTLIPAIAQRHGSHHDDIPAITAHGLPSETGQSAFAAIAEIVRILDADSDTDWSTVDIAKLRNHLVDMDELTLRSTVERRMEGKTVTYIVTGEGRTIDAIRSMVPAHTKELDKIATWSASATLLPTGAALIMNPGSEMELTKIIALGFFGLMATGSHHQPHHLAMATGRSEHQ